MFMSLNRLRDLFQAGKRAIGTFVSMGNESLVECLGYTGLNFVIIDTEHGPFDTETMMNLIRAAERVGLVPVVRIANVDHKEIQRAADCGAQGLIVPCLRDVADFQKTVALAKYAPVGQRGFIKGRGTGFGQLPWAATDTLEAYYANSNDRLMVIPQCETKEALEHIEDIAAMEGIDGIFIGPFDLSTSMGLPGQFTHPDFLAAKARILQACQQVKKPCYIFTTKAEEAAACLDDGYAGVAHELDFDILIEAYRHVVTDIRSFQEKRY